ncbi:hypothetical protein P9112_002941 [Eukaryota sp. TZLM1-RC]
MTSSPTGRKNCMIFDLLSQRRYKFGKYSICTHLVMYVLAWSKNPAFANCLLDVCDSSASCLINQVPRIYGLILDDPCFLFSCVFDLLFDLNVERQSLQPIYLTVFVLLPLDQNCMMQSVISFFVCLSRTRSNPF